jgi:hypothetical protein
MRVIIAHDSKGDINSVAFLAEDAGDLELQPGPGKRVVTVDSSDLPERADDSELRGERLVQYGARIREKLQVVKGKVVRRAQ